MAFDVQTLTDAARCAECLSPNQKQNVLLYLLNGILENGSGGGGLHNLLSLTHPDTVPGPPFRGSLIVGNATPDWEVLLIGANGTFLGSNGTDASWIALPGSFTGFANPTASVGLVAVNGVATTAMRSDAAPPIDVTISPTWSGTHTFTASATIIGSAANALNVIQIVPPAALGANMVDLFSDGGPGYNSIRKYFSSPFQVEIASSGGIDFVIDSNNNETGQSVKFLTNALRGGAQTTLFTFLDSGVLVFSPVVAGAIQFNPFGAAAGNTSEMRYLELLANGTNYTGFKAPDSLAASEIYVFPDAAPAANRFLRAGAVAAGVSTLSWAQASLTADVTGTLPVGNGGTGLTTGTSGGILGFTAATTITSSVLLTTNALILGGGAGATPVPMASLGTTTTVLHGNAAGAPTFGAVVLTTDVSGILPVANGGSGTSTAFTAGSVIFAGAAGVFSQDNASFFWDDTNNRLGIGTAGPMAKLQIISSMARAFQVSGLNDKGYYITDTATYSEIVGVNAAASIYNGLNLRAGSFDQLYLATSGNVGIGTTGPTALLHVTNSAAATVATIIKAAAAQSANLTEWQSSAGAVLTCVDEVGQVGIGVLNPTVPLDIAGRVNAAFTATGANQIGILSTLTSSASANANCIGISGVSVSTNSSGLNVVKGGRFEGRIMTSGTASGDYGIGAEAVARQGSSRPVGFLIALTSTIAVDDSSGTVSVAQGYVLQSSIGAGATVDSLRHVQLDNATGAGALGTQFGLLVSALTKGSSNWAIYVVSTQSYFGGKVGCGISSPTALLDLGAGTTTANTAPLKFNTGTSMTATEVGAVEFTTDDLFFTITTGAARKRLLMADATAGLTSGKMPIATTNGRLIDLTASSAYTLTNGTIDRTVDINATSLDEIADLVYSMWSDLNAKGILG